MFAELEARWILKLVGRARRAAVYFTVRDPLAAGFSRIQLETVALTTRVSASHAAQGLVLGSPFRSEIERRDSSALIRAVDAVTAAPARWDGNDAPMSAHVVTATNE